MLVNTSLLGELLKRGFDAQLADRNTKGYDVLAGSAENASLQKVQVKTVRAQPWYVKTADFKGERLDHVTVYVLLGAQEDNKPVRFFIAKNRDLAKQVHCPPKWKLNGFMTMRAVRQYENRWEILRK